MKLRNKIKLSFLIITMLPILLMLLSITVLGKIQVKSIENHYGIQINGYTSLINPSKLYSAVTDKEIEEIDKCIESEPDKLKNTKYLNAINNRLLEKFSYLLVISDGELMYNGSSDGISQEVIDVVNNISVGMKSDICRMVSSGDKDYIIRVVNVTFSNGVGGTVCFVTDYGQTFPQIRELLSEMLLIVIMIVIATGALLTFWIYKSVMKPLSDLGEATKNISEGNLDFEIPVNGADEFSELCSDFDEMRRRLKESAEEKIRNDNESKVLISNISHDLKTPITSIKGYVEGIMDGVADTPEKMDKYIRTIYNKANDMDKLIGELTEYSKIDTNRVPYNFAKVNVSEYFADCVDEIKIDLEQKGITLSYFNYVDEDTVVITDAEQLKRVINNIISNSVKYIGVKAGIINIRINDEGDFVHIELEDNGKGIPQKDLTLIFERFYRTDASRNSDQGGSGIGLSIAKKIIEEHNGKIWATSKEGMGTTMHIVLRKYLIKNMEEDNNE